MAKPVIDTVYPVNPVTKRRNIRVVPEFLVNELGIRSFSQDCSEENRCKKKKWAKAVEIVNEVGDSLRAKSDLPVLPNNLKWEFRVKQAKEGGMPSAIPGVRPTSQLDF